VKRRTSLLLLLPLALGFAFALILSSDLAAQTENILHDFHPVERGYQPNGGVIADAAGNLYGVTQWGGPTGLGAVYELTPNSHGGWTENVIYAFKGGSDVFDPCSSLIFDKAGNLYGAAIGGGAQGLGGVFRMAPNSHGGWTETVIASLNGYQPDGGFVFDSKGNLYGVVGLGPKNAGSVFELTPQSNGSWTMQTLYVFSGGADGNAPYPNLVLDGSGNLFGTTGSGGINDRGVVFQLSPSAGGKWTESVAYSFAGGSDGGGPDGGLAMDQTGNLYGTTIGAGGTACQYGCGVIFKLTKGSGGQWSESVLYDFNGGTDGENPEGPVTFDQAGNLYGTTSLGGDVNCLPPAGCGTVFELSPGANGQWSEKVVWSFTNGADGQLYGPYGPPFGVLVGAGGQLYGIATGGNDGNGVVFQLTQGGNGQWTETTLTDFPYTDGGGPQTGMIFDNAGTLYGTTSGGGKYGHGTVFTLARSGKNTWAYTTIYDFPIGQQPSPLVFDAAGNLYGEMAYRDAQAHGFVFELSPSSNGSWTKKDLYAFKGNKDGGNPYGGLILDQAGNLYGTTEYGGMSGCGSACGTVFKLTPGANGKWTESVLYSFVGGVDGAGPVGGLVFDQAGNLYGTTQRGGNHSFVCSTAGCGTVFKLSPNSGGSWTETQLYQFTRMKGDGSWPMAGLVFDQAGNLYGTTLNGGTHTLDCEVGCGAVFELSPTAGGGWTLTTIAQFAGTDANYPVAPVIVDAAGNVYGTAEGGLGYIDGTVFEISPSSGGWNEILLHEFMWSTIGSTDGVFPEGGLVMDQAGHLYGTTLGGGTRRSGTVFEITP